jgi:hypothetical protein
VYNAGVLSGVARAVLTNTLIWGNIPPTRTIGVSGSGGGRSVTSSLVQGGFTGTNVMDANPLFVNAAAGDLRLLPGSPALDAGTNVGAPTRDVRDFSRPANGVADIGAYEMYVFSMTIGRLQTTTVGTSFAVLVVTVTNNGGEPVGPGGVVTFTPPASGPGLNTRTPFTRTTNAAGVATAPATANGVAGSYVVTVTVRGVPGVLRYALTNRATAKGRPPTADGQPTTDNRRQKGKEHPSAVLN